MKLLFIFMTACLMQVSASSYAQRITLSERNASLMQIFSKISKQSGMNFLVSNELLKDAKAIDIDVKNEELTKVLNKIFEEQPLSYVIEDNAVIVSRKTPSFLETVIAKLGAIDVRGKVIGENDEVLVGATIKVKGTSKSVSTDAEGEFYLQNVEEGAVLVVSYMGYKSRELKVASELGSIKLEMASAELEEVTINKGYYSVSKQLNTGNVSTVSAVTIGKQPVGDPLQALIGRTPGLYIAQSSGVPGAGFTVQLRGQNSLANNNNPFYIVDGVPFISEGLLQNASAAGSLSDVSPFVNIRPEDIESIEVLKDADATAIYGSRGANGVILITTKKGKSGNTVIAANLNTGVGQAISKLKLMNTEEYLGMRYEALKNDNRVPAPADYDLNGTYDQDRYTDWKEVLTGGTARINNLNADISGGSAAITFLVGGNYRDESTVFPGDYGSTIGSARFNLNHLPDGKKYFLNLSAFYVHSNLQLPIEDFTRHIFLAPNTPALYTEDGQLNWVNAAFRNPFSQLERRNTGITKNLNSRLELGVSIIEGMHIKVAAGFSSIVVNETSKTPFSAYNPALATSANLYRNSQIANNSTNSWIADPQLTYEKQLDKHQVNIDIGGSFQHTETLRGKNTYGGFSSDLLLDNPNASAPNLRSVYKVSGLYRYNALFGRFGYNYESRYVVNITARRDGSSRFGPGKQFGNFGALGVAWILSKEYFMKNIALLSFAKLRASIGTAGNDPGADYGYLSSYQVDNAYLDNSYTLYPIRLANPEFRWEAVRKIEAGLELGILNDKLMLDLSVYRNRTSNQLVGYALPSITGFTTIQANLPAVIQNKGLELNMNSTNISNNIFSWTSKFNISFQRNKLVSYPNLAGSSYANTYVIGQPLSIKFLYESTGVDPTTGIYSFKDFNNDQAINILDKKPVDLDRDFYGSLGNTFRYKGINLDFLFYFVKQRGSNTLTNNSPGRFNVAGYNQPADLVNKHWQAPGDVAQYQKYTALLTGAYQSYWLFNESDARISDASFIRLQNVNLSWDLPDSWMQRLKLQSLKLYLQGQNLLTVTKFKGVDPETNRFNYPVGLPPLRVVTAGIQLKY